MPEPVPPSGHPYKYRLVYVVEGKRMVGYDNERGKGDHKHFGDREEPYRFLNPRQLMADFIPNSSLEPNSPFPIVRFAETLAEEVRGTGIDVNAIAPGALNTRMLDEVLEAGPEKVGKAFYERSLKQKVSGGAPLDQGAELALFLASAASDGITGKLISAVWDDWEHWPEHLDELSSSDAYTLRRIAGRDRGFAWGDK